jgi:hypothetical protein
VVVRRHVLKVLGPKGHAKHNPERAVAWLFGRYRGPLAMSKRQRPRQGPLAGAKKGALVAGKARETLPAKRLWPAFSLGGRWTAGTAVNRRGGGGSSKEGWSQSKKEWAWLADKGRTGADRAALPGGPRRFDLTLDIGAVL